MSSCNFASALAHVLVHEGGYVNHPRDPGGATNRGVTQEVYHHWRDDEKLARRSVKHIEQSEVEAIYRKLYWDAIQGDKLPDGVDYCVFDFAVNSGTNRSARYLQRAVQVAEDGKIGPMTLAAVITTEPTARLIDLLCNMRLAFLRNLPTFDTFGRGWTRRVEDVRDKAKAMV